MADHERILLVQERYHSNQHEVVKTLLDRGHSVQFLAMRTGPSEVYDAVKPDIVRISPIFSLFYSLIHNIVGDSFRQRYAYPSLLWYYRYLRSVNPDIVIVKKYFMISFVTIVYARVLGFNLVFYDQAPIHDDTSSYQKRRLASILYRALFGNPFVRISPILGDPTQEYAVPRSYYMPFVVRCDDNIEERRYFRNDAINIIMVGRYTAPRKNHLAFLTAVDSLISDYDLNVTLVGSLDDWDNPHFQNIQEFIAENGLSDVVDVRYNVPYEELQEAYRRHDVFVLPSEKEAAAITPLEAMSNGLPVIGSTSKGVKCYVHHGENGYVVAGGDPDEIQDALERLVSSKDQVREFGRRSCKLAKSEHSPYRYYEQFSRILNENFR